MDGSQSYSIRDDCEERSQMYETKPPPRTDRAKEQKWRDTESDHRREEREYRPLERGENYQYLVHLPPKAERREEYQLKWRSRY